MTRKNRQIWILQIVLPSTANLPRLKRVRNLIRITLDENIKTNAKDETKQDEEKTNLLQEKEQEEDSLKDTRFSQLKKPERLKKKLLGYRRRKKEEQSFKLCILLFYTLSSSFLGVPVSKILLTSLRKTDQMFFHPSSFILEKTLQGKK